MAAVSTSDGRRPRKIKLLPVKGCREKEVKRLVGEHLASTGRLVTDGPGCWTAAAEAGLERTAVVTGGGKRAAGRSPFRRVDTPPGDVEAVIVGTYRRVSPKHAGRCPGSFARRHDRRFRLDTMLPRPVRRAVRTAPLPCPKLVAG